MRCSTIAFAFASLVPAVDAGVVGLDAVHGSSKSELASGSGLDDFRALLAAEGHTIVSLASFDAASLAGLDAVFLKQPDAGEPAFSAGDIADLQAFVTAGGGLVLFADTGSSGSSSVSQINTLFSPWGVSWGTSQTMPTGYVVSGFVSHAVTAGVAKVGLDFLRPMTSIVAPAVDLTPGGASDDSFAATQGTGGAGNVVGLSDLSGFLDQGAGADWDILDHDNKQFLTNVIRWTVFADCDDDGIEDTDEIAAGTSLDCDGNGLPDECQISAGTSPDLDGDGLIDGCPFLSPDVSTVSVAGGGVQTLTQAVGPNYAGKLYLVLGTITGTQPGIPAGSEVLPLNPDPYFFQTLTAPDFPPLSGSLATLDPLGRGTTTVTVPPGAPPIFVGVTAHHASVVMDVVPVFQVLLVSNPVPLDFLP